MTFYLKQTILLGLYDRYLLSAGYLPCSQEMGEADQAGKGNAVGGK